MADSKPKVTVAKVRVCLADYFQEKAAYRRGLAEKCDRRCDPQGAIKNGSYAESLERMAAYVAGLPDNDPTLNALAACPHLYCEYTEMFRLPQGNPEQGCTFYDRQTVHCGPRDKVIDDDERPEWFAAWADCVLGEAEELVRQEEEWMREMTGVDDAEETP